MIFVFNDLKYDTDKMEKISDKIMFRIKMEVFGSYYYLLKSATLYISNKERWLITYKRGCMIHGQPISKEEAKDLLKQYDLNTYERLFSELEEA